jgi:cytochrome c2
VRLVAATLGLGAALALAGCGTGSVAGKGDANHGKTLFSQAQKVDGGSYSCAGCHTLADANAFGKIGPNLDTTFAFARITRKTKGGKEFAGGDSFCGNTIENVVLDQIKFPSKNNLEPQLVMPANIFKGQDAVDVAAYVAKVAGLEPGKAGTQAGSC